MVTELDSEMHAVTRPALSSIVANSQSGTLAALDLGFLHASIARLRSVQLRLALAPRHSSKVSPFSNHLTKFYVKEVTP